jgi:Mn-dependent DtxR family transcriptional regulator
MTSGELTDEVRRFILTSIPSVPYLEAILLLRTEPATGWDAQRVARRLYVSEKQAAELLQSLAQAGIAQLNDASASLYRYEPAAPELAERLEQLADAYAANLVGVTGLIHSRIDKRAQQFADAFRLRKDS